MESGGSILESVGSEIIAVMSPVSICMLLVVLLVYSLSSPSSPLSDIRTAANLVYLESPTDSTAEKLEGSLLNAVVFVVLIALVTFLLVLLYYYRCTNFLKNYTRFSSFFVLSFMGGPIFLTIIEHFSIPIDSITCFVLMFNFSVLGVMSIFSNGVPILIRQSYMVCLGIIVAAWFTRLPEWTSWALLVALALYDLVAVLAPGGPLKILVELASSREEELPALVYESRPSVNSGLPVSILAGMAQSSGNESGSVEMQGISRSSEIEEVVGDGGQEERSPLMAEGSREREEGCGSVVEDGDEMVTISDRGIKLGLGDFVFYSVLVGRAAMYDLMTVYACYLAIISGLGCTLILLAFCRQALPALPISIALGIIFYFLTRLLMEPFVVGTATNLMMF